MKTVEISEDTIWQLKNLAESPTCYEEDEDFDTSDYCKADCYHLGEGDGMIILAREILRKMGIEYTQDLP